MGKNVTAELLVIPDSNEKIYVIIYSQIPCKIKMLICL